MPGTPELVGDDEGHHFCQCPLCLSACITIRKVSVLSTGQRKTARRKEMEDKLK